LELGLEFIMGAMKSKGTIKILEKWEKSGKLLNVRIKPNPARSYI
jgi:hypothetical protein